MAQATRNRRLLAAIAAVIAVAAATGCDIGRERGGLAPVAAGTLVAVTTTAGPIYYGRIAEMAPGYVKITDTYYVETTVNAAGQRENRLVNRRRNDWHAPEWMMLPGDRIATLEPVGSNSKLAQLIEQDKKQP